MTTPHAHPGRYTLLHLGHELAAQGPRVIHGLPDFVRGFTGEGRLAGSTRLAVQLRFAQLLGCPVCKALFPKLAPKAGMDAEAVQSAFEGRPAGLSEEAGAALAFVDAVVGADGAIPHELPDAAMKLSEAQRRHLVQGVRIEMLVHSVGLMFLPHSMIERAAAI